MNHIPLHRAEILVLLHLVRIGHHLPQQIVNTVLLVSQIASIVVVLGSTRIANHLVVEVGGHAVSAAVAGSLMTPFDLLLHRNVHQSTSFELGRVLVRLARASQVSAGGAVIILASCQFLVLLQWLVGFGHMLGASLTLRRDLLEQRVARWLDGHGHLLLLLLANCTSVIVPGRLLLQIAVLNNLVAQLAGTPARLLVHILLLLLLVILLLVVPHVMVRA